MEIAMKRILILAVALVGCGEEQEGCKVIEVEKGALLECNGDSVFVEDGNDGVDGVNGINGENGNNYVNKVFDCRAAIGATLVSFHYQVVVMHVGDVWAHGTIIGSKYQASNSAYYSFANNEAKMAQVEIFYDTQGNDNHGQWKISADRYRLQALVEYRDPDVGEMSWTMDVCELEFDFQ